MVGHKYSKPGESLLAKLIEGKSGIVLNKNIAGRCEYNKKRVGGREEP